MLGCTLASASGFRIAAPQMTSEEQRRQVWSGCQSILGCAGLIALFALFWFVIGRVFRSVAAAPNVIVFFDQRGAQNGIVSLALFGGVFFLGMLAAVKTTKGIVIVCAVFVAALALSAWSLYGYVAAIEFRDREVLLHYVWPRPSVSLQRSEIASVDWDDSVHAGDDAAFEYTLYLHTSRGDYSTFADTNLSDVQNAQRRIEAMR